MPKGRFDAEEQSTETSKDEDLKKGKKKPDLSTDATTLTSDSPSPSPLTSKTMFTASDFSKLSDNEHSRYVPNSEKVGHAVLTEKAGETIAAQYTLPLVKDDKTPKVRPLINIEHIEPFRGMHRYRAQTPDGKTTMYAKRFIEGKVGDKNGDESIQIACFSPSAQKGKEPFWGSIRETPVFRDDLSKAVKKDLEKELKEIKQVTKGGDELVVDHASVPQRDLIKTRTPDQNTIMGESARDAYENFFDTMVDELHPEMKQRLKRAFSADIKDHFSKNNFRPEWLHAKGWSLMPMDQDPQTEKNLGAGPKWANTQMMVLERVIKWFALNAPESLLTIKPKFDMLLDSEIIKHIDFKVKVKIKERFVELAKSIDPFQPYPLFPKASDLAQSTGIAYSMLHGIPPESKQTVSGVKKQQKENKAAASKDKELATPVSVSSVDTTSFSTLSDTSDQENPDDTLVDSPIPSRGPKQSSKESSHSAATSKQKPLGSKDASRKRKADVALDEETSKVKRAKYPTSQQYDHSVVQIFADSFSPDYDNPWRDPESSACSGSGFIIQDDLGKKYVVTNAHVAENPIFLQIRLANDRLKKYEAKVKCVSYQCDLALLEVDDPEFSEIAQPVELGDMVDLRQKIMVVGFPVGGTEMSISRGIVSRIQVDTYSMSSQRLLQVQVDAAINPGNSGGPTFSEGKVVGVAFQGYEGYQGLGYIIPIPILRHFLTEALSSKSYRGFPSLPIVIEELENPHERAFYNLGKRTGVRIKKVDNLSDAFSKLKADDILLKIDGLPISNEGTVDIPGIGNCIDYFHVTQSKFIGDKVTLRVLRRNPATKTGDEFDVDVILDTILGDTEKVAVEEHDKMPTFYINSGISFVPLTRNYMEGEGSTFEEMHLIEEGCTLPDAPKKNPEEQVIVINTILKCTETQGYEKHVNGIVKEINGKPINNIKDVLLAMEGSKEKRHVISLASNSKIVVPNMSSREHNQLLKRHFISHDRSEDLVATSAAKAIPRVHIEDKELCPSKRKSGPSKPYSSDTKQLTLVESSDEEEETESELSSSELSSSELSSSKDFSPKSLSSSLQLFEHSLDGIDEEDEEDDVDSEEEEAEKDMSTEDEEDAPAESSTKLHRQNAILLTHKFFKPSLPEKGQAEVGKTPALTFK